MPETFDFRQSLVYLARSLQEPLHAVDGSRVRKLIRAGDRDILFELEQPVPGTLRIRCLNGGVRQEQERALVGYVREWLDLDRDLEGLHRLAPRDPVVQSLLQGYPGLRLVRIHDLFQALCWAILGQQVNIAFAYTLYRRVVEAYGRSEMYDGRHYWLFPQAQTVAGLAPADLRPLQLTGRKAQYLIGVAQAIASARLDKEQLLGYGDFALARERLLQIRGVGPWTASYVLLRCLGDVDAFPMADVGLHNAIRQLLGRPQKPDIYEIKALAGNWNGWRGYIAFYLYRSLL